MKAFLTGLVHKWKFILLPALLQLGGWGFLLVTVLDSSSIPVPMDLLVAGYIWADKPHFLYYPLLGGLGSALGGLVPFFLGRAGGEIFLLKRVNRARFEQMRDRFEKQEFLAMLIPSMMPPPTPWKAFAFAAGVFEMKILLFMAAVFLGRFLRWTLLGLLVIRFGPQIVGVIMQTLRLHAAATLGAVGIAILILVVLALRKPRGRHAETAGSSSGSRP